MYVDHIINEYYTDREIKASSQSLYFGRDPLGRRSLLVHWPTTHQPCFVLSSVSDGVDDFLFEEVDTKSIFCIQFADIATDERVGFFHTIPP